MKILPKKDFCQVLFWELYFDFQKIRNKEKLCCYFFLIFRIYNLLNAFTIWRIYLINFNKNTFIYNSSHLIVSYWFFVKKYLAYIIFILIIPSKIYIQVIRRHLFIFFVGKYITMKNFYHIFFVEPSSIKTL